MLDDNSSEAFLPLAAVTAKRLAYTCSKCYEEFKSRNKLDKHRQTHKPQIPCPHPGCTFTHTKQSKVNKHVKRCDLHKTVYQCSVCPRKPFDTPTGLDDHLKLKHWEELFVTSDPQSILPDSPPILLNHTTSSVSQSFKSPVKRKRKKKSIQCLYCTRSFASASNQYQHLKAVHAELPSKFEACIM